MSETNLPKFIFCRTKEVMEHNGVIGNRGILLVNGKTYFTIERDIEGFVNIPFGIYKLKMEYSPTKTVKSNIYPFIKGIELPRKQFRIRGHNVPGKDGLANLLIHQGKYPNTLLGCIAPGKQLISGGIDQSSLAMDELFLACGGFKEKEEAATLEVVSTLSIYDPIGTQPTF